MFLKNCQGRKVKFLCIPTPFKYIPRWKYIPGLKFLLYQIAYAENLYFRGKLQIITVTGRFSPIPVRTPGRFGPIPFRSGRFGLGHFGPISGVGRFGQTLAGRFGTFHFIWIFKCLKLFWVDFMQF